MFYTNLDKKISEIQEVHTIPTICSWSDLLGFAEPYVKSNWEPCETEYRKIAERLRSMQIICARNLVAMEENVIVSNDAIMRNLNFESINHIELISMWFRSLIYFHMAVNTWEKRHGYPGMRTVVAGGERLLHSFDDARFEDFIFNYTKKDPEGESSLPQEMRDRIVMYSPAAFQMNTGFSKSYILDGLGSKYGLEGANIYIDQSVLKCLKHTAYFLRIEQSQIIQKETDMGIHFFIVNPENHWFHMGFELGKPLQVSSKRLSTTVYKLLYFYPWDEDPKDFRIDPAADFPYLTIPVSI